MLNVADDNLRMRYFVFGIVFVLLCSLIFGVGMFFRSQINLEGFFIDYQSMGSPPQDIQKISMTVFNGVVVQTKDGNYYLGNLENCLSKNKKNKKGCWSPFWESVQDGYVEKNEHNCMIKFRVKPVPSDAVQSMDYSHCNPSIRYDRFVLLSDGMIWVWHNELSDLAPLMPSLFAAPYGLVIGFFVGLFLVIFYSTIIWLKKKYFQEK